LSESNNIKTLEDLYKSVSKWLLYAGLLVFCPLVILRIEILSIFGPEFVLGGSIFIALGIGHLANVITGPTGQMLVMTGKEKWEVINSLLIVVINFILNLLLIPEMGAIGAAIATAISICSINIVKIIEVYLLCNIQPYSFKLFKGVFAILFGSVVCYLVRLMSLEYSMGILLIIFLACVSFLIITITSMWILGLDNDDKALVEILKRR